MSTSWIELYNWQNEFNFNSFAWDEWIDGLELPMPIYDLAKILDASAAFDMASHAFCWTNQECLQPVHFTYHMKEMMHALQLHEPHQQQYMARALYAHCSQYVLGMPVIRNPPCSHIEFLPVVPLQCLESLAAATLTPMPASRLSKWLRRVIKHRYSKPLQLQNKYQSSRSSGRRGRKHSCSLEHKQLSEKVQHTTENSFTQIQKLSPNIVPRMRCSVVSITADTISLALSVQR